jgi:putative metallohydrolase (TIGR04338 family)
LEGSKLTKWGFERDGQRQRLYDAERDVDVGKPLPKVSDMQDYLDRMVAEDWWTAAFRVERIYVYDGRGRTSATGYPTDAREGAIKMPRWSRHEIFVLHEVAHVLVWHRPHAGHGRLFARVFLELVRCQMGEAAWEDLQGAFTAHNVKWWKA